MNKQPDTKFTLQYIQTPLRVSSPVKIDVILQQRLRSFMRDKNRTSL